MQKNGKKSEHGMKERKTIYYTHRTKRKTPAIKYEKRRYFKMKKYSKKILNEIKKYNIHQQEIFQVLQQQGVLQLQQQALPKQENPGETSNVNETSQALSFLNAQNLQSLQSDRAFRNFIARVEAMNLQIIQLEKGMRTLENYSKKHDRKIRLLFEIVRQIGYCAGAVEYVTTDKEMLPRWKKFYKRTHKMKKADKFSPIKIQL